MLRFQGAESTGWLAMSLVVLTCWVMGECQSEIPAGAGAGAGCGGRSLEATESAVVGKLPVEVAAVQRAVRQQLILKTDNRLLRRLQREHSGTDVLAYQFPTRMRPVVVHRSGGAMWRLSSLTANRVGQVPVIVVLGRGGVAGVVKQPGWGGQLFVLALCDPKRPERTRICMMFTTSSIREAPGRQSSSKRDS